MPWSAYPKKYKLGKDNDVWWKRWVFKYIQVPLTGGPRVIPASSFWKWREIPMTLFAIRGEGDWRVENTDGSKVWDIVTWRIKSLNIFAKSYEYYLSRIQPWTRWHFALMWPLGIHWSIIWREKDVVKYPKYKSNFGIKKMFAGYLGWIRDSDKIYKPKLYIGGNFE